MARDLRLDITSDSASARRGLDQTARAVDNLADQTKQLERAFISSSGAAVVIAKRIDNIGDQARQSSRAVDELGDQLGQLGRKGLTGGAVAAIGPEFAKLGAKAGTETASTFSAAFQGGIMEAFKSLPPEAKGALAAGLGGAVLALAPFIAATVSAAVIGSVGAGGLIGGIVLAARDQRVKDAFKDFGSTALRVLDDASKSFVRPLVSAAGIFKDAFKGPDIAGPLKEIFGELAKDVEPLAAGLAALVKQALPGIRDAAKTAGPFFKALADEMPKIGAAISSFFGSIARAGPGAIDGLKTLLFILEAILITVGHLIEDSARLYEGLYRLSGNEAFDRLTKGGAAVGQVMDGAASATDDAATAFSTAAGASDRFRDSLDRLFQQSQDLVGTTIGYKQALADLKEQLKQHKGQWDLNTQAGRDNARAFEDAIRSAYDMRQALIDQQGPSAAVDQQFQDMMYTIILMAKAAGASQQQIDFLTQAWRNLYQEPSEKVFKVRIIQTGTVSAAGVESAGEVRGTGGRAIARAGGGPVWPGQLFKVGEHGVEYVRFAAAGEVYTSQADARRMTSRYAGTAPASAASSGYALPPMSVIEQALAVVVMRLQRTGQLQNA